MTSNVPKQMGLLVSIILIYMTLTPHALSDATRLYNKTKETFSINEYIFAIESESKMTVISKCFPNMLASSSLIIQNIGRNQVIVSSTELSLRKFVFVKSVALVPNERSIFKVHRIYSHIEILNNCSTRAILYVFGKNAKKYFPTKNYDKDKALKKAFTLGVKDMPNIDNGLSALLSAFWPQHQENIWEQVHQVLKTFLSEILEEKISANIKGKITNIKHFIVELNELMITKKKTNIASHYMNIAALLVPLEREFIFRNESWTSFYILPYYSNVITMKMHFYAIGIGKPEWFHLSEYQINEVKQYAKKTIYGIKGAIEYVKDMYSCIIDKIYNSVYPGGLYNVMMNARSHIALHGLEMIPKWEMAYNNPTSKKRAYVDVISYSNFYGIATPTLFQQATPINVPAPLTPPLINGIRAKLLTIQCYTESTFSTLVGLKLTFEDSSSHLLGKISETTDIIDLNNKTITKLGVFGDGTVIHSLSFYCSNGNHNCGKGKSENFQIFSLRAHHIASLYLVNGKDSFFPGTPEFANIAVSYLQNPFEK